MRQFVKLLLLAVLVSVLPSGSFAQQSARRTRKPSTPAVICNLASVPKGLVVVGYRSNSACGDGAQLLIKRPENGDIICAESPVPPGFSITTEAQGNAAGTCPNKAFLITGASSGAASGRRQSADDVIGQAFANGSSNIQVEGEGTVIRLLPDDSNGSRHQRFIIELASGITVLITHNIDIAPRLDALEIGDTVSFNGEYIWNAKGGLVHWTHHDPQRRHVAGWLVHNGKTYQ
jgi:uncharacterized protein DUF3465